MLLQISSVSRFGRTSLCYPIPDVPVGEDDPRTSGKVQARLAEPIGVFSSRDETRFASADKPPRRRPVRTGSLHNTTKTRSSAGRAGLRRHSMSRFRPGPPNKRTCRSGPCPAWAPCGARRSSGISHSIAPSRFLVLNGPHGSRLLPRSAHRAQVGQARPGPRLCRGLRKGSRAFTLRPSTRIARIRLRGVEAAGRCSNAIAPTILAWAISPRR